MYPLAVVRVSVAQAEDLKVEDACDNLGWAEEDHIDHGEDTMVQEAVDYRNWAQDEELQEGQGGQLQVSLEEGHFQ